MSAPLVPCETCARHVTVHERVCPFCAATLVVRAPRTRSAVGARAVLTRTMLVAGVGFVGASLGCAVDPGPPQGVDPADSSTVPTIDAGPLVADAADANANADVGSIVAMYGAPGYECDVAAAGSTSSNPGVVDLFGLGAIALIAARRRTRR